MKNKTLTSMKSVFLDARDCRFGSYRNQILDF